MSVAIQGSDGRISRRQFLGRAGRWCGAAAVSGALLDWLVACGGTGSSPAGGGQASGGGGGGKKLIIAEPVHALSYLPLYIAVRQGFFKEQGLDVSVSTFSGGSGHTDAVLRGDAFAFIGGPEHNAFANFKGANLRAIVNVVDRCSYWFIRGKDVPASSDVAAMVKGKTFATWVHGGTPNSNTLYLLKKAGLDPNKDVTLLEFNDPAAIINTVVLGKAQIGITTEPVLSAATLKGQIPEPWYDAPKEWGPYAYSAINLPLKTVEGDPKTCQAFVNGMIKGTKTLYADPKAALAVAKQEFPTLDDQVLAAAHKRNQDDNIYSKDGSLSRQSIAMAVEQVKVAGLYDGEGKYEDIVDDRFLKSAGA